MELDDRVVRLRDGSAQDRRGGVTRLVATTDGVRVRTHHTDGVVDELFTRLLAIEAALAPRGTESPYR